MVKPITAINNSARIRQAYIIHKEEMAENLHNEIGDEMKTTNNY